MAEQDKTKNNRSIELCRRTVTTESFIEEAKAIYGDRYDYSKVNYINSDHRVIVTCHVHGDFEIYAREHLDGKGCPKCEKGDKFIVKLKEKFGDKFGLEEFVYQSSTLPVTLTCPKHGSFSDLPNRLLYSNYGCPGCAKDIKEESHNASVARKEDLKRQKQIEREAFETQRLQDWLDEMAKRKRDREEALKLYYEGKQTLYSPLFLYRALVDDHIEGIRYGSWKTNYYKRYLLDEEEARGLSCYNEGDLFYKFPGEAPSPSIKQMYDRKYAIYGQGFEEALSHRRCNVYFFGDDLIIKEVSYEHEMEQYAAHYLAHKIISNKLPSDFVSIDFETLYAQRVSACSVGMVKYVDGKIVDRYYSLIRPPFDYPGKCGDSLTWVNGITEEMVKDARTFAEILPEMERFVGGLPLVAHNACVERACIRETSAYYGIETKLDFENIFDTLPLSRRAEEKLGIFEKGPGTHQLDTVCRRFGISGNNHHNALADAEMSGNLMVIFQKVLEDEEIVEVVKAAPAPRQKYNPEDMVQRTDIESVTDNPFKNQVVVLTGFSSSDSQVYGHKLNELGAIIKNSVSGKTNILITGYNAGPSKMQKAQELGIRIMPEEEFLEIIKQL